MPGHRPGSAPQADPTMALRCVTLPEIPTVYALHEPDGGVTAWVLALLGGQAYIVSSGEEGTGVVHTSLEMVVRRWAPRRGADLVLVTV